MILPGLTSVTFRSLEVDEIIDLCKESRIKGIEWGGDIHVPPGEVGLASEIREKCHQGGIEIAAYGSYYRAGCVDPQNQDFGEVLSTAMALGAPCIRVWPGPKGPGETSPQLFDRVCQDLIRIADQAEEQGIRIVLEHYAKTLTETDESLQKLLTRVNHPKVEMLWQYQPHRTEGENLKSLEICLPRLANLHVFYWTDALERRPLCEGSDFWSTVLDRVHSTEKEKRRFALLEFVRDDSVEQFREDARTLDEWTRGLSGNG